MRVLICGDRGWSDRQAIAEFVELLSDDSVVIHGGARGADRMAGEEAAARGLEVIEVKADWARYGRAAGPIRNAAMLDEDPELVVAFHEDLSESKGTANMVKQARKAGLPVDVKGAAVT